MLSREEAIAEFEPPKQSVRWAQDAVRELSEAATAFFAKPNLTAPVMQLDGQTGERVYKIVLVERFPESFARKATEALTTTRHAFDQAIFAAKNLVSGRSADSIYYPWANTPRDLEHLLKSRSIDQRLWSTIQSHEPYPRSNTHVGGDDGIRALAKIANRKHTIGLSLGGIVLQLGSPDIVGLRYQSLKFFTPIWDSKKNEAELARWIGDIEVRGNYRVTLQIILEDPSFSEPMNILPALKSFTTKANSVIETLQARCLEILGL